MMLQNELNTHLSDGGEFILLLIQCFENKQHITNNTMSRIKKTIIGL